MQNTSRHIEHFEYTIDYGFWGNAAAEQPASLRRRDHSELTVACLIVHAVARTLVKFRQFCCAVDGSDYVENLTFADPICVHWEVHVDGTIQSHRSVTSPQDLTLAELGRILHRPDGGIDNSASSEEDPLGEPAFVVRHCEGSARDADLDPASVAAALLLSEPAADGDQNVTATASTLAARLTYDRRIISHTDVLDFVAAFENNLRSTTRS